MGGMVGTVETMTFDGWRALYDELTDEEQFEYARELAVLYPDQERANLGACERFFADTPLPLGCVLEIGGWNGSLAAQILTTHPELLSWTNIDPNADRSQVTSDSRYRPLVPVFFYWWRYREYPLFREYDTLVASHVLEHFKVRDIHDMLSALPEVLYAYVECPIAQTGENDWAGYDGTHILECGWDGLTEVFKQHGFQDKGTHQGDCRAYSRDHTDDPGAR